MNNESKARKILNTFIKNCDNLDNAFERVESEVIGELEEFTARNLDGYMAYGNGEVLVYVDEVEEPWVIYVDNYGGNKTFTWG